MNIKNLLSMVLTSALIFGSSQLVFAQKGSGYMKDGAEVIKIIERPGYFETHGNVFQIQPGMYEFKVTNKAGKDAGFVLGREGESDQVIIIKEGETGSLKTELKTGKYVYYCPIIPTAHYSIIVK